MSEGPSISPSTHEDDEVMTEELDPRAAQERLEEAFGPARPENEDELDTDDDEQSDRVVPLTEDGDIPSLDNPFAQEAAETLALRRLEALLFASPQPISEAVLAERVPGADIPALLEQLSQQYANRGIHLRQVDRKWQFVTAPDVANVLVEYRVQQRKLSRAALETLAIIAYHQPCSRADIEEVRGVAVAKGSLDQLLELGWIRIRGRREVPGRPVLYGTTSSFNEHFGLSDIGDLPGLTDLKAAGLLEARLPPGFEVPTPKSNDDEIADEDPDMDAEFTADFHGEIEDDAPDSEDE